MFERTLQDLIRGLRAHKASSKAQEDAFIQEAMVEIREELKGKDMALKGEGIIKMCYLMMLYPIPPPPGFAFHVVEVMSSPRYHLKQLGYLASPMAFSGDTEEVVLTVNGIKKDLMSPHLPLPPLPLSALPHLLSLSPSLSHTLHPDLLHLLTHSSPRIRKRAVLCLLPCWEAYPDGLREGFPRLRERLLDEDQGVVGATVGVVMELARRQGGKNYLPLAPELFGILTGSSNNWMLIKVVKLFAILTPREPRLVRKLLGPITSLISSTSAISLLYECVRTCIVGGMLDPDRPEGEALARVCVEKLGGYLRDEGGDQNLRYIALLAMVKITPTHPHMIAEYQEEIVQSLDDPDVSIRMRALELVTSMVDESNVQSIVDQLLAHLAPPENASSALPSAAATLAALNNSSQGAAQDASTTSASVSLSPAYRLLLTQRLLSIISHDTYANVTDFEWVVSVLVDVAYVSKVNVGSRIKDMLLDVVGRVRSVRPFAVRVLEKALNDEGLRERAGEKTGEDGLIDAAIWICAEYPSDLTSQLSVISSILSPTFAQASPHILSTSIQAVAKIFGYYAAHVSTTWSADTHEELKNLVSSIKSAVSPLRSSAEIEVQERAFELIQLLSFVEADLRQHAPPKASTSEGVPGVEGGFGADDSIADPPYPKSLFLLQPLFTSHELNAVATQAQGSVRVPDGLDLDRDFVPGGGFPEDLEKDEEEEAQSEDEAGIDLGTGGGKGMEELRRVLREQEAEEKAARKGKKAKGKGKKVDGEVLSPEQRAEKEKRKAARRQKAKDDPYYLYDEKDELKDEVDVDDIPIVRLDLDLPVDDDSSVKVEKSSRSKGKGEKPRPVDFDRAGEMPADAPMEPPAQAVEEAEHPKGLAGVDLLNGSSHSSRPSSRFEEYKVDEEEEGGHRATPQSVDTPAVSAAEGVEVIKVKRKKRKDGEKKRREKAEVS
ncbi:armadillo-type protein [Papiliotrema laurentii]|uniref:AP-3 complex subunit delta n=1 Tax=Papiliotrema laurentii TaxID=5418 RepID=A0AAD9D2G0_PAPLA|nr:armadillo-type protein [Papiliotrema laurentii]